MRAALSIFVTMLVSAPALAETPVGERTVKLVDQNGDAEVIATIAFKPSAGGSAYTIDWRDEVFTDHFLSMRPFKCLEGPETLWCRVPYPYAIERRVTPDDLTDLEYDTLFVWKGAGEYGINLWNGIYYRMKRDENGIAGDLHEFDANLLAVPPEDGNLRPISGQDLEPGDPESHWLPRIVIE